MPESRKAQVIGPIKALFWDIAHVFYPGSYTLENGKTVKERFNPIPYLTILFLVFVYFCSVFTGTNLQLLAEKGHNFFEILHKMIPP